MAEMWTLVAFIGAFQNVRTTLPLVDHVKSRPDWLTTPCIQSKVGYSLAYQTLGSQHIFKRIMPSEIRVPACTAGANRTEASQKKLGVACRKSKRGEVSGGSASYCRQTFLLPSRPEVIRLGKTCVSASGVDRSCSSWAQYLLLRPKVSKHDNHICRVLRQHCSASNLNLNMPRSQAQVPISMGKQFRRRSIARSVLYCATWRLSLASAPPETFICKLNLKSA